MNAGSRSFRSDNNAGLCPEALQALIDANDGTHAVGYGDDAWSQRAQSAFEALFGTDIEIGFVATGTAANTLAIASLTEPWQEVLCHHQSHYAEDESTAPERIAQCRTTAIRCSESKLRPADLEACARGRGDVHQPQPGVVTLTNPTELGTVYTPDETRALCATAHGLGFRVHVDGARFANAVAFLDCEARELTVDAGVDALSFGGTKDGAAFGEAVIFFAQGDGATQRRAAHAFAFHRKSTGHLLSKHRFVAAPLAALLESGAWLRHARHANSMARRLADGLAQIGLQPAHAVESNGVFVHLPGAVDRALREAGYGYYPFGGGERTIYRLMCSFDTQPEEVDAFISVAARAAS